MDRQQTIDKPQEYRYFAFVSYSRKDMPWAKWLQKKLQNYMLPSKLIRTHKGLPKRITPVFRDQQDISGNVLENALHQALDDSRYLIVICSPNSAKSIYVNEEVRYFVSLGRQEQIIPLIVSGTAFSGDPETECFPEALRAITPELLGINIQEYGKRMAFLRIVSTMLRIHHDEIVKRDGTRRLIRRIAAATAAVILAAAGAWGIWYNTPHSHYYNAYTTRYEVPEGICQLTEEQLQSASEYYRITTLRGNVIRLETLNSQGTVTDPAVSLSFTDYPRQEFVRFDDRGRPIEIDLYDAQGNLVLQKNLSYGDLQDQIIIDFQKPGSGMGVVSDTADNGGQVGASAGASQVIRQVNTYDQSGLMIQCKYYKNTTGTPAADAYGVYSKVYTYTENGLIESITSLDRDGELVSNDLLPSQEVFRYSDSGCVVFVAAYQAVGGDPQGELLYEKHYEVDPHTGNTTSIRFYGENQTPILWNGYHEVRAEYDTLGHKTVQRYFGTNGKPILMGESHEIHWEYDENGRKAAQLHFGLKGDPVISDGIHIIRWEYAENGAETAQRYFDTNGEPMLRGGYHALIQVYDEKGNVAVKQFFGTEEEPIMPEGYHEVRGEYDENGNCICLAFFDTQGQPIEVDGYHKLRTAYDDSGNLTSFRQFNKDDQPIMVDGFHEISTDYDENGNLVSMRYFNENREPIKPDGFHETRFQYDENENLILLAFFDENQEPILLGSYHKIRSEYDDQGNLTSDRYFDTNGKPAHFQGYHEVMHFYDDHGNRIFTRYFNREMDPVYGPDGYHEIRYGYDENGNITSLRYFDNSRSPMIYDGYHELRCKYNDQGEIIYLAIYDAQGNLLYEE